MSEAVITVQVIFIFFIMIMAFVSGVLPTKIPWCKNSINILGIANAFSGGVFIAIAFMHIMPEQTSSYASYRQSKDDDDEMFYGQNPLRDDDDDDDDYFPLPFLLVVLGYTFILLIDKVIFDTHSLVDSHGHGHGNAHGHDLVQQNFVNNVRSSFTKVQAMLTEDAMNSKEARENNIKDNTDQINDSIKQYLSRNDKFAVRMSRALRKSKKEKFSRSHIAVDNGLDDELASLFEDRKNVHFNKDNTDQVEIEQLRPPATRWYKCDLTPVVLMIALSTHALFEGIAVGLVDKVSDIWTYIIAIGLHKWAAAMSLGISMSKNFKQEGDYTIYLLLVIFSLSTPIGVSIGMIVSGSSEITEIVFASLAAGTFVYIACSEVIVEEFSTPNYKWVKLLMFFLGGTIITCLHFIES